jgi:hypothetical protein
MRRTSASCGRGGTAPSLSRRARAPTLTRSRFRRGCSAVRRSTSTSWKTSGPTPHRLRARSGLHEGEHEVKLLLNRKEKRGVTRYLVRWRGHTYADDEWLRTGELVHCPEKVVAEYEAAPAAPRLAACVPPPGVGGAARWQGAGRCLGTVPAAPRGLGNGTSPPRVPASRLLAVARGPAAFLWWDGRNGLPGPGDSDSPSPGL